MKFWYRSMATSLAVALLTMGMGMALLAEGRRCRVVLLPFALDGGREGTRKCVREVLEEVFDRYDLVPLGQMEEAAREMGIEVHSELTEGQRLALGKRCQARYVVSGRLRIRSRRQWAPLPVARGDTWLDTTIIDVEQGTIAYDAIDRQATTRQNDNSTIAVAAVALFSGISRSADSKQATAVVLISLGGLRLLGGDRAGQEKRAVARVLEDTYARFFEDSRKGQQVIEMPPEGQEIRH